MSVTDTTTPPTAAPPADPVRAALDDPAVRSRVLNQARASYRGNPGHLDDIVQTACSRALAKGASYDAARGSVVGWICGFVPFVCLEFSRKEGRQPRHRPDFDLSEVATRPDPDDAVAEWREMFETCLESLSQADRDILDLAFIRCWGHDRIASHYGISNAAVRKRASRAMFNVRQVANSLRTGGQS